MLNHFLEFSRHFPIVFWFSVCYWGAQSYSNSWSFVWNLYFILSECLYPYIIFSLSPVLKFHHVVFGLMWFYCCLFVFSLCCSLAGTLHSANSHSSVLGFFSPLMLMIFFPLFFLVFLSRTPVYLVLVACFVLWPCLFLSCLISNKNSFLFEIKQKNSEIFFACRGSVFQFLLLPPWIIIIFLLFLLFIYVSSKFFFLHFFGGIIHI